jgi:hypothetical protein
MVPECKCEHCGYDLTGLTARICPECGTDIPGSPTPLIPRTDARRAWSKWTGIVGWCLFVGSLLSMVVWLGSRFVVVLICAGIPLAMALASSWPWYRVLKRAKFSRTLADDLFVAFWPWIFVIAAALGELL